MAFEIENGVLKIYTAENGETKVVIPDSVTEIGYMVFYGCTSLTEVTIPDSVTKIGEDAFWGCSSLTEVTIPDSVTEIGENAFYECKSLTEVTIPDSVTEIGDSAFSRTKWLEEYPEDLVIVGNGILIEYKGNDENVVIPDSVTKIGGSAFYGCESLKEVTIPDSVTEIGESAFSECESLKEVTIPDSVTTIGDRAFKECESLKEATIPDSVTRIGNCAFDVKTIKFQNGHEITISDEDMKGVKESRALAWTMLLSKDFSCKFSHKLKFKLIFDYYIAKEDEDALAYIKKNFTKFMKQVIDNDDVRRVILILETGKFITDKNILKFIDYANEQGRMEIQLKLMNYSHEHFKPKKTNFKI